MRPRSTPDDKKMDTICYKERVDKLALFVYIRGVARSFDAQPKTPAQGAQRASYFDDCVGRPR